MANLTKTDRFVGFCGLVAVAGGVVLTVWGMAEDKDVNSIGLASIFIVGIGLIYAGFFHVTPSEVVLGDKGTIKMQAAADATAVLKTSAKEQAAQLAVSPSAQKAVMQANDAVSAERAVKNIAAQLLNGLPTTNKVLEAVR